MPTRLHCCHGKTTLPGGASDGGGAVDDADRVAAAAGGGGEGHGDPPGLHCIEAEASTAGWEQRRSRSSRKKAHDGTKKTLILQGLKVHGTKVLMRTAAIHPECRKKLRAF